MIVRSVELTLRLDGCFSLKDKRRVLRSIIDRVRRDFHVSVGEIGDNDLWNAARIGIAAVGNDPRHLEAVLGQVQNRFDECPELVVEEAIARVERYD